MNTITIVGNVGDAPKTNEFASGVKLVKLSLAENQFRAGQQDEEPLWHDCEFWGELADRLLKCDIQPGKQMVITGILQKNNYEKTIGQETIKMRRVKVKVQSFQLVGKKNASESPSEAREEGSHQVAEIHNAKPARGRRQRA